ncbi:MAG: C25 family cysteine peptidase [Bellilinea sp.]
MKRSIFTRLISFLLAVCLLLPAHAAPARAQSTLPVYLIIAPDEFEYALGPFVNLKTSQGFQVALALLSETGSTKVQIKDYIKAYRPRPKYVLLAGDTNLIPSWPATNAIPGTQGPCPNSANQLRPCTDLYYATFDGSNDILPDVILGRLPVQDELQLGALINKFIGFEQALPDAPWRKKISFVANDNVDYYAVSEGAHNDAIDGWTDQYFYGTFDRTGASTLGGDRLYPHQDSYQAEEQDLLASINDGRLMVIYHGPGSSTAWQWRTGEDFIAADVAALSGPPVPLVLALANNTADFATDVSMADAWLLHETAGALAYIGTSFELYADRNDDLENIFFGELFAHPGSPPSIGEALKNTLIKFKTVYSVSVTTQYLEAYQILGDPSLKIIPPSGGHLESPAINYYGHLGETIVLPFSLTNTRPVTTKFSLAISDSPYFTTALELLVVELIPLEKREMSAYIRSLEGTDPGVQQFFDITASIDEVVSTLTVSVQVLDPPLNYVYLPFIGDSP